MRLENLYNKKHCVVSSFGLMTSSKMAHKNKCSSQTCVSLAYSNIKQRVAKMLSNTCEF